MANPTYGDKKENVTYQPRYGVYAVYSGCGEKTNCLSSSSQWLLGSCQVRRD